MPWESSGKINADGSPQVVPESAEAWLTKPGVRLKRADKKTELAELGLSLLGCEVDGSAASAKGVASKERACSGQERAKLARLVADLGAVGSLGTSVEVASLRGPASKVFVNPDGTMLRVRLRVLMARMFGFELQGCADRYVRNARRFQSDVGVGPFGLKLGNPKTVFEAVGSDDEATVYDDLTIESLMNALAWLIANLGF